MNKETIENAADKFATAYIGVSKKFRDRSLDDAFLQGAKWRINSVWHDKSELPRICKYIFVECKYIDAPPSYFVIESWDFKRYSVSRWAYLEDLLPD